MQNIFPDSNYEIGQKEEPPEKSCYLVFSQTHRSHFSSGILASVGTAPLVGLCFQKGQQSECPDGPVESQFTAITALSPHWSSPPQSSTSPPDAPVSRAQSCVHPGGMWVSSRRHSPSAPWLWTSCSGYDRLPPHSKRVAPSSGVSHLVRSDVIPSSCWHETYGR